MDTLIYLHGAFDLFDRGVVDLACREGGALRRACDAVGMKLVNPQNENALATDWHLGQARERVLRLAEEARGQGGRVFLAGHSMGGRGALMIGLENSGLFDALGAIAPALGVGIDAGALIGVGAKKFSPSDLRTALQGTAVRAFFGYSESDLVVQLQAWHFDHVASERRTVRRYEVPWGLPLPSFPALVAAMSAPFAEDSILLDPHNKLVAMSAVDLVGFFQGLP